MADFLEATLERVSELRNAETPGTYIKQRMAVAAESLSNAARIQGTIEAVNEALYKVAALCYETVEGQKVNVDSRTYRLLVPLPWGDSGYVKWGMRAVEARILRSVLMTRANSDQSALFDYADRRWFLNAAMYKNSQAALTYLRENPISGREWIRHSNAWHERELQRWNDKYKKG